VKPVTLGVVDGDRVAVTQGLKSGDVVVTEGGDRLRDGADVVLPGTAPKPAAGSPGTAPGTPPAAPGTRGHRPRTHNQPAT
jgi:multidrug efflux system membrane fusion protein